MGEDPERARVGLGCTNALFVFNKHPMCFFLETTLDVLLNHGNYFVRRVQNHETYGHLRALLIGPNELVGVTDMSQCQK
jgi:hypothetical protein